MDKGLMQGKKENLFFYLLILTSFYLLIEISFFIQCNRTYLGDFTFVSNNIRLPLTILPGLMFFVFAQWLVHFGYCVLIWTMTIAIAYLFRLKKTIPLGVGIWILGTLTLLVCNEYYFPNSKFAGLSSIILFNHHITQTCLSIFLLPCGLLLCLAAVQLIKTLFSKSFLYLPLLAALFLTGGVFLNKPITKSAASVQQPNIIFIGVDSLRPDFLSYFGADSATPFFDSFLNNAVVFSEAVTPLARTFPSWTSILTGLYPPEVGIRSNLAQYNPDNLAHSLPAILRREGYETIFATDETRFSNIDKNFGFDQIISPPIGLNDFLIGTFNDFPLSNLLVNTIIGKWLFPYSYANRPVYFTYQPNSFLNLVKPMLEKQRTKPLFLAIHFCVTHHPYLWANLRADKFTALERYAASVHLADEQINHFFALMKQNHLLDHAIVVLLSDHGEALELSGDRITGKELFLPRQPLPQFYPSSLDKEAIDQSAGHGTDVLGLPQYHTLLAFRFYGLNSAPKGDIPGVVSLVDIQSTLLQLLGVNTEAQKGVGRSLAPLIKGDERSLPPRHIFIESDFSPAAIRTVYPETRDVLLEGIQLFQINPATTRLSVKDSMMKMIIASKQYADIYGDWMLALYPQSKAARMPILVNLQTGQWTNDLNSAFAIQSPAAEMLLKLKVFYGLMG